MKNKRYPDGVFCAYPSIRSWVHINGLACPQHCWGRGKAGCTLYERYEDKLKRKILDPQPRKRPHCFGDPYNPEKTFLDCTLCPFLDDCCLEAVK